MIYATKITTQLRVLAASGTGVKAGGIHNHHQKVLNKCFLIFAKQHKENNCTSIFSMV